jgi:hypothetical protein
MAHCILENDRLGPGLTARMHHGQPELQCHYSSNTQECKAFSINRLLCKF